MVGQLVMVRAQCVHHASNLGERVFSSAKCAAASFFLSEIGAEVGVFDNIRGLIFRAGHNQRVIAIDEPAPACAGTHQGR
jgi:hypothetical protein